MKLAVIGSRSFNNFELLNDEIQTLDFEITGRHLLVIWKIIRSGTQTNSVTDHCLHNLRKKGRNFTGLE